MTEAELERIKELINKPYFLSRNFLTRKTIGLPYIRYRLLRPLLKLYYRSYKQLHKPTPWTTPASIILFENLLNREQKGFEWGSGSSTLFFGSRLKKLVSVEHHEGWYAKVMKMIRKQQLSNVDLKLVSIKYPDPQLDRDGFQPALSARQEEAYREYFSLIENYPDNYFDFILIDGRARVKCGEHAIPKLKPGGMLVLDNSERKRYQPLHESLSHWPQVWTTTGLTDTTIWFKP